MGDKDKPSPQPPEAHVSQAVRTRPGWTQSMPDQGHTPDMGAQPQLRCPLLCKDAPGETGTITTGKERRGAHS